VEGFCDGKKQLFDVNVGKGTCLIEDGVDLLGQSLSLLTRHCPLTLQVTLIPHDGHNDFLLSEVLDVTEPARQTIKGGPVVNAVGLSEGCSTRMTASAP
jgi:hypothetical protein